MSGFLYGVALQWKLDIRSKSLLVTCYIIPLIFFLLMGGIFTSVMPDMRSTLIQSMIIMSVSMGAFIGLPPSLIETYGSDINKVYKSHLQGYHKEKPPEMDGLNYTLIPRRRAAAWDKARGQSCRTAHFCRSVGASCTRPFR